MSRSTSKQLPRSTVRSVRWKPISGASDPAGQITLTTRSGATAAHPVKEVFPMTKTSSIKNYLKDIAAQYGRILELDGRTWCF